MSTSSQLQQQHMVVEEEDSYDMDMTPLLSRDGDVASDWCTIPQTTPVQYPSTKHPRTQFPQRRQSLGVLWQPPSNYAPPLAPRPSQSTIFTPSSRQSLPRQQQRRPSMDQQDTEHRLSAISDASAPSMIEDHTGSSDSDASFDDSDYHARSALNFDSFYRGGSPKPPRTAASHRRYGIPPFPPQPEDMAQLPALSKRADLAQYNARALKRVPVPTNIQILPLPEQQGHARNYSSWPLSAQQPVSYPAAAAAAPRHITAHASRPSYSASTKSAGSFAASTTSTAPSFSTATTPSSSPVVSPVTPNFAFNASAATLRNSTSTTASAFISPVGSQYEEKSAWDDSDDEDERTFTLFKDRLHIRSPSDGRKNVRRSASSVIKGVFRKEKR